MFQNRHGAEDKIQGYVGGWGLISFVFVCLK